MVCGHAGHAGDDADRWSTRSRAATGRARRSSSISRSAAGAGSIFRCGRCATGTGQVVAIVPEAIELTERRKAEEAFRQAQKMEAIGQLTGGVAHDFNNLLTVIRSSADLLRRRQLSPERMRRYVDAISDTADRAAKLTGQLLAFARRTPMERRVFDAARHIGADRGDVADRARRAMPRSSSICSRGRCRVDVDVNQFETALVNLVANARDAMDGRGSLDAFAASDAPTDSEGQQADPGREGSRSCRSRSVTPDAAFRWIRSTAFSSRSSRPRASGAAPVSACRRSTGSSISRAAGSWPRVRLGRNDADPACSLDAEAPPRGRAAQADADLLPARWNVLVVEDNLDDRRVLDAAARGSRLQDGAGPERNGSLRTIEDDPDRFDLVLSDVVMPGMDGVTLGKEIRRRLPDHSDRAQQRL